MIRNFLVAAALIACCSCNNETKTEDTTTASETAAPATETTPAAPVANAEIDPVCDMPREASWTDYTVNGADTVWFCSETCKTAYEGNPAKYGKKG